MQIPLNTALMAHPANWIVVLLMVAIAGLGLSLLFTPSTITGET